MALEAEHLAAAQQHGLGEIVEQIVLLSAPILPQLDRTGVAVELAPELRPRASRSSRTRPCATPRAMVVISSVERPREIPDE